MKKTVMITNLLIVGMLMLTSAGTPVLAQSGDETEPQATNAMPAPTIVFPGFERPDNPLTDLDVYPVAPPDPLLNDPRTIGAVPDVSGAAGFQWYIQAVNKHWGLWYKDGTPFFEEDIGTFWGLWANTGTACDDPLNHHGQPNVLFDPKAARFIVTDVAYADIDNGPYFICAFTSDENTFISELYFFALDTNEGIARYYPDSIKLGLWQDAYYLAANLIDINNSGFQRTPRGAKVWALKRDDLTSCRDENLDGICEFDYMDHYLSEQLGYHYLVPSNYLGNPPSANEPNYFAAIQPGKFHIWEFVVNWNDPSSTFGADQNYSPNYSLNTDTSAIWATGNIIPQDDVSELVDVHGERLMSPLQYRTIDGAASLWATHTVLNNSSTGKRWYEIRFAENGDPIFFQEGTYAPDNRYRWNGSLAVDRAGNMALGYNVSSASMYPQIRYAGRLRTDPAGELALGEVRLKKNNFPIYNGSQYDLDGIPDGPWGRQSQMSVDPLDDCVFWYTNMYYDNQSDGYDWRTAIGWFSLPQCRGGRTKRVSLHTNDTQGNGSSGLDFEMYSVATSGNGRFVAFSSKATNLVDDDSNGKRDVFLRDRDRDGDGVYDEPGDVRTTRISTGYDGSEANADSWEVSISRSGRYIAFSSDASNLVEDDTNGFRDVFVYDRIDKEIERASVQNLSENGNGNDASDQPFISNNLYVVFRSNADNLIPGQIDANGVADIFVRDLILDRTTLISVDEFSNPALLESATPSISHNGRFVAFSSRDNLAGTDNNFPGWDVFIREWGGSTPSTMRVSNPAGGDLGDSYTPYISGNSQFVTYASRAYSLDAVEAAGDYDADIFVYDRINLTTNRVSVNFFGQEAQNGDSYSPSITTDGRYIAFASDANNLDVLLPDTNARRDIYFHDRTLGLNLIWTNFGLTQRTSLSYLGGETNDGSFAPVIAPNGRHIAFVSSATNLVNNDTNNVWDVFAYDSQRTIPTFLVIPTNVSGGVGDVVSVPVEFQNGMNIDTTTFSIDFDELCLSFDEDMPGAVSFEVPSDFQTTWGYDADDTDGEIDISIYDQTTPRTVLEEGTLLRIKFTINSACMAPPGSTNNARVGFSSDPLASFGSYGQSIPGYASDGFVRILDGKLGDCNGDGDVDAGDLSGLVLEIFDGDDVFPQDTPGGTFLGNPVGCNPNQDMVVDAGDLSCTVLIIFGSGEAACTGGVNMRTLSGSFIDKVNLTIPDMIPAVPGQHVALPVSLDSNGMDVSSAAFSIDFDQSWLSFDTTDEDKDGLPDAIHFKLPEGFVALASFDPQDTDGEIDIVIYYSGLEQASLPSDDIVTVFLDAGQPQGDFVAKVKSSPDPLASFGSPAGASLPGTLEDGSVLIFGTSISRIFLPVTIYER